MEKQTKVDRITSLPWDVLDTIFSHLPLRETARTCILSSQWRYKWTGLSQFVVDDECLRTNLSDPGARWREIMKILDHIRSNHGGSIEKFKLAAYCCPEYSDLDQWIQFLTEKGIKELCITEFKFIKRFKLPSCLFTCTQLSCLELYGCFLKLPHPFNGFNSLRSLHLYQVSISDDCTLENLISNCPVLERLTLLNINHLSFLRIHNPSLSYLKVDSQFEDICLENCPCLSSVDICMIPRSGKVTTWNLRPVRVCNLAGVFDCLSGIKRLALSCLFLEFVGSNDVPERLPTLLKSLLALELKELRFNSVKEVMVSLSILGSSPNLEELVISVGHSNEALAAAELLKKQSVIDMHFNRLKIVKIRGIWGTRPEWEFVKFILASSPVLEMMTVVRYGGERIPESVFLQAERASLNLKIVSLTL